MCYSLCYRIVSSVLLIRMLVVDLHEVIQSLAVCVVQIHVIAMFCDNIEDIVYHDGISCTRLNSLCESEVSDGILKLLVCQVLLKSCPV